MSPPDSALAIKNLSTTYGKGAKQFKAVNDVSLHVDPGELLVLLGPSGCGKTTILRSVAGLERPDAGTISIGGRDVVNAEQGVYLAPNKRDLSLVFQHYALWPHMTVQQNIEFPLQSRKWPKDERAARVEELLGFVRCDGLGKRLPSELSGGQQQRIALARALAPSPGVILLDEPLSNIDALLRTDLRAELRAMHRAIGFTGVYVTHDQDEALALGTKVAVMAAGEVRQVGGPEEVFQRPADPEVALFLGVSNSWDVAVDDGRLLATGADGVYQPQALMTLSGSLATAARSLRARPEHTRFVDPSGVVRDGEIVVDEVRILDVVYGGTDVEIFAESVTGRAGAVRAKRLLGDVDDAAVPGATVLCAVETDHALLYGETAFIDVLSACTPVVAG